MATLSVRLAKQRGITLLEAIVTLGLCAFVFIAVLSLYSTTFRTIRTRDSMLDILHDADLIMAYIGNDLRATIEFLNNYQSDAAHTVIAALKVKTGMSGNSQERLVVYALQNDHPNRLMRSVYTGEHVTSVELSPHLRKLVVVPTAARVFEVQLILEATVSGKVNTLQTSSAFASRY